MAAAGGLRLNDWELCIAEGNASQRIIEHEQAKDCGLVLLGKHGQSATEDLLPGSISKHVLAKGSTDVLVSTAREARRGSRDLCHVRSAALRRRRCSTAARRRLTPCAPSWRCSC